MNSIYFVSRAKVTGPINQGLNILDGMKQNGRVHSYFVTINPEGQSSWLQRYKDAGIDICQFNLPTWRIISAVKQLRRLVAEKSIQVIHACGFRAVLISLVAHTSAKIVITQRCDPKEIAEKYNKLIQKPCTKFYLYLIKKVDSIVACSESLQSILIEHYKIGAECIQNGVNTDLFVPATDSEKKKLREELSLPLDKRIYLVLGSLRDRKNNRLIVNAFNKQASNNYYTVLVGSGPEANSLKELADGNMNISFPGSTKYPIKYLQASDVLVSASLAEGLPNSVLEALSCGVPCILSDIDPHKELIGGSKAGYIFNRYSVTDLCVKIADSYTWDMNFKSEEARRVAVERFSVKLLAEKYERVYEKVLGR